MKLETMIKKIRDDLGMEVIDNSKQEKREKLKWDILFDNAMKICEADDVEFDEQIVCIQDNEGLDIKIVQTPVREEGPLTRLKDTFSKIGIKATRNSFYETMEDYKWNEKKKLINELCDSENIEFEVYANITLTEDGFKVDLNQRIVHTVCNDIENEDASLNEDDDISLVLNIDTELYKEKPNTEVPIIQNRIGLCKTTVNVNEFIEAIESGRSFKAAALNGNKNIDWESQQVFALDIDNKGEEFEKYGILTPEDAYRRLSALEIPPAFCYESFSSTQEIPKFRLVFILKNPVTDVRVRNAIQMALMNIIPECDRACKDLSRLFFGTNKKCMLFDASINVLDPDKLIHNLQVHIKKAYSNNGNHVRAIKNYCKTVGLNMVNGVPDVTIIDDDEIDENTVNSIIYNIELTPKSSKKIRFNFSIDKETAYKLAINNKKRAPKVDILMNRVNHERTIDDFDFYKLQSSCQLWNEFVTGEKWCYHEEIFGMSTNMWRVQGAESIMIDAIKHNNYYKEQADNKINTIKNSAKYGYVPMRCTNFCEYCNNCPNKGVNMLQAIDNKRGQIRKLKEDTVTSLSIEDGVARLQDAIIEAYNTEENTITIIKAPTGIGKTEALKHLNSYDNTVIAYPNHRLGIDIVERLSIDDSIHIKELELEDGQIINEFRRLQQIGAYKQARHFIEKYRNKMLQKYLEGLITDAEKEKTVDKINEYLSGIDESKKTSKLIFCTHKKALEIDNKNIQTYIIDEDIAASTLISTMDITLSELQELIVTCEKIDVLNLKEQLNILRTNVIKAQMNPGIPIAIPKFTINTKEVNTLIENKKNCININLKELLKMNAIITDQNGATLGMGVSELPNKRCIILSATANEAIYKGLFPDRKINFVDIGNIETEGQIVLHYTGCSRSKLNKDFDKVVEQIKTEAVGISSLITFIKYEEKFKKEGFDTITHFGACSGLDSYKGQDLIVVGTPHADERVYRLLAAIIDGKVEEHEKISYINARRNGFEFYFNTYEEGSLLQEIQFYYIESELVQAIGRARVLRTNATVHVFSNYPVRGAVLYDKKIS